MGGVTTNAFWYDDAVHDQPNYGAIVATRLVQAAVCAQDGDREAAQAHIEHAVALLQGNPPTMPPLASSCAATRRALRGGLAHWQAQRLVVHINANLANSLGTTQLATFVGLSTSQFGRAFKCTFGMSPHMYLTRRRIEVAQTLMLTTNDSLRDIALRCGMSDQSHLTRWFRRTVGETPFAWRRNRRGALVPCA